MAILRPSVDLHRADLSAGQCGGEAKGVIEQLQPSRAKVLWYGHANRPDGLQKEVHVLEDLDALALDQLTSAGPVHQTLAGEAKRQRDAIVHQRTDEADVEGLQQVLCEAHGNLIAEEGERSCFLVQLISMTMIHSQRWGN